MLILQSTTTSYSFGPWNAFNAAGTSSKPMLLRSISEIALVLPTTRNLQTLPITAMSAKWDIKNHKKSKEKTECWSKKKLTQSAAEIPSATKNEMRAWSFLRCWDDHFWFYLFQSMIAPAALSVQLVLATIYIQETVVLCNKKNHRQKPHQQGTHCPIKAWAITSDEIDLRVLQVQECYITFPSLLFGNKHRNRGRWSMESIASSILQTTVIWVICICTVMFTCTVCVYIYASISYSKKTEAPVAHLLWHRENAGQLQGIIVPGSRLRVSSWAGWHVSPTAVSSPSHTARARRIGKDAPRPPKTMGFMGFPWLERKSY